MNILIYDVSLKPSLGLQFQAAQLGHFDWTFGIKRWHDFYALMHSFLPTPGKEELEQLHFWLDSEPGAPLVGGVRPNPGRLVDVLEPLFLPHGVIWFRAGDVFAGPDGQQFAYHLASRLGVCVVGHTRKPGSVFHSGGYGLRPGEEPYWNASDRGRSGPFRKNTCLITTVNPPVEWFTKYQDEDVQDHDRDAER